MERILLLSPLLLVAVHCLLPNAKRHILKTIYKPYGPRMCGEMCNDSIHSYIYNKEDLSCRNLHTDYSSDGKLSVGGFLMCLKYNPELAVNDSKLMPEYHTCFDSSKGETSSNRQVIASGDLHQNHTMKLHTACKDGKLCLVQHILSQGLVDINCRGKEGYTPVMTAARHGQAEVFDYLVAEGCDLTVVNVYNNTILHAACAGGNTDIVRKLVIDRKHAVDSRGGNGLTPVMYASYRGHVEVFDLLLSKGCNSTLVDVDNDNLLHIACRGGKVNMVKHILKLNLFSIDILGQYGRTPVIVAAVKGYVSVVDFLVSKHCNMTAKDNQGNNLLHMASLAGKVKMVKYIVEHNMVDIDSVGYGARTAVMMAAVMGRRGVVDLLYSKNCSMTAVDNDKCNMLHLICGSGLISMAKHVLELNVIDIDSKEHHGRTAAMLAVGHGHREIVQSLVRRNCNLKATDDNKNNILHLACITGKVSIVRYILRLNVVNIDSRGQCGRTPMMAAALRYHIGVVSLLASEKCDWNITDTTGNNILHQLCLVGMVNMVRYILELNVLGVDTRGQYGRTAAMLAAERGHHEVVKFLVNRNCDLEAVDTDGSNILHMACMGGDIEMVRYILSCAPVLSKGKNKHGQTSAKLAEKIGHLKIAHLLKAKERL